MLRNVVLMLRSGIVHGDLSAFNVLVDQHGPIITDLPQAVDAAANPRAGECEHRGPPQGGELKVGDWQVRASDMSVSCRHSVDLMSATTIPSQSHYSEPSNTDRLIRMDRSKAWRPHDAGLLVGHDRHDNGFAMKW